MACLAPEIRHHERPRIGSGPYRAAIIADYGERARVVVVTFSHPPTVGDRFEFNNASWEIVQGRSAERGFVARPIQPCDC